MPLGAEGAGVTSARQAAQRIPLPPAAKMPPRGRLSLLLRLDELSLVSTSGAATSNVSVPDTRLRSAGGIPTSGYSDLNHGYKDVGTQEEFSKAHAVAPGRGRPPGHAHCVIRDAFLLTGSATWGCVKTWHCCPFQSLNLFLKAHKYSGFNNDDDSAIDNWQLIQKQCMVPRTRRGREERTPSTRRRLAPEWLDSR